MVRKAEKVGNNKRELHAYLLIDLGGRISSGLIRLIVKCLISSGLIHLLNLSLDRRRKDNHSLQVLRHTVVKMPTSLVSQCLALMAAMAALLVRQLQVATDWIDALIRKEPIETDESKVLRQWYCRTCRARVVGLRCPGCYHTPRNPKNGEAYREDL